MKYYALRLKQGGQYYSHIHISDDKEVVISTPHIQRAKWFDNYDWQSKDGKELYRVKDLLEEQRISSYIVVVKIDVWEL